MGYLSCRTEAALGTCENAHQKHKRQRQRPVNPQIFTFSVSHFRTSVPCSLLCLKFLSPLFLAHTSSLLLHCKPHMLAEGSSLPSSAMQGMVSFVDYLGRVRFLFSCPFVFKCVLGETLFQDFCTLTSRLTVL